MFERRTRHQDPPTDANGRQLAPPARAVRSVPADAESKGHFGNRQDDSLVRERVVHRSSPHVPLDGTCHPVW